MIYNMKKILVTAFDDFLYDKINSSKTFLNEIAESKNIFKHIFQVGYFKNDFIKLIKKSKPQKVIFFGMDVNAKFPKIETIARNEMIVLKNSIYRFVGTSYTYWLKWNNKSYKIKNSISKDLLTVVPISKNKPKKIKLKSKIPKFKEIKVSNDAENFVCNYSMWVVQNYINENNLNVDFYFIHLPPKLNKKQKKELLDFVTS